MGKRASGIAVLLSLTFFGSLLGLALVGQRRLAEQHPRVEAASPLAPGVEASPVQVEVPVSAGSPRPTVQGEPEGPEPVPPPAGNGGGEHGERDSAETPPAAEPPPLPATEPPLAEPPPTESKGDEATTHLKAGGEEASERNDTEPKDKDDPKSTDKQKDKQQKEKGSGRSKNKDNGSEDQGGPKDKEKAMGGSNCQGANEGSGKEGRDMDRGSGNEGET